MLRELNPVDQTMAAAHEVLCSWGYGGFLNQTHLWLDGRIDAEALRSAISRLSARHPIVASRLVRCGRRTYWRQQPEGTCTLSEVVVPADDDSAVLRYAEALISTPLDLEHADPIGFFLLRRGDGGDVLVIQHSHAMMDMHALLLVLEEINRPAEDPQTGDGLLHPEPDGVREHLRRIPRWERYRAAVRLVPGRFASAMAPSIRLADRDSSQDAPAPQRIAIRWLDEAQTRRFTANIERVPSLPSASLGLLACVLRTVAALTPESYGRRGRFKITVGVNIRSRAPRGVILQNMTSAVQLCLPLAEIGERDDLIRSLNGRMRKLIGDGQDIGALQVLSLRRPRPQALKRWTRWSLRRQYSFLHGYIHWLPRYPDRVCNARLQRVSQTVGSWKPHGLSVAAVRFGETLGLTAAYCPDILPEERIERFLDEVVREMTA